jgi:outer membrane protein
MKKLIILSLLSVFALLAYSQRFAYVDVQFILSNVPEYEAAQLKLDEISSSWQEEVQIKRKEIEELYNNYRDEQVLYTDDMRRRKEEEINQKEEIINKYRKEKFGYKGELFKKRQELVKPIQDQIYEHIQKLAKEKRYDFIFDKSAGVHILFANPSLDKSKVILKSMGYTSTKN